MEAKELSAVNRNFRYVCFWPWNCLSSGQIWTQFRMYASFVDSWWNYKTNWCGTTVIFAFEIDGGKRTEVGFSLQLSSSCKSRQKQGFWPWDRLGSSQTQTQTQFLWLCACTPQWLTPMCPLWILDEIPKSSGVEQSFDRVFFAFRPAGYTSLDLLQTCLKRFTMISTNQISSRSSIPLFRLVCFSLSPSFSSFVVFLGGLFGSLITAKTATPGCQFPF